MADSDDEIPPLEDMTEVLQQAEVLRGITLQSDSTKPKTDSKTTSNGVQQSKTEQTKTDDQATKKPSQKQETKTYAGMKKGFLLGSSSKPKQTRQPKQTTVPKVKDDIPLIRPKEPMDGDSKVKPIPEVQEALKNSFPLQDKEWINDDLLKNLEKNPDLMRKLTNPSFSQALAKFQTNPQLAAQEYADNPEMQKFFSDFCSVLGDHFNKLADTQEQSTQQQTSQYHPGQVRTHDASGGADIREHTSQSQPSSEDLQQMQDILSRPDIQSVLQDMRIQKLIEVLRSNPEEAQRIISKADSEMKVKIQKLVDVGLLGFSR